MIVLMDGPASDYFLQHENNRESAQNIISEFCGKEVETVFQSVGSTTEFEYTFPDISKMIHMDIEIED